MNKTIDYYNANSSEFYASTVDSDMSAQYIMFEKRLPAGARVLDCGCGSGRDSKHFMEQGYEVTAIDGSVEMCRMASELTGLEVRNLLLQDIDYSDEFDGVWACASLVHISIPEITDVLKKICTSMKTGGVLYVSFKYGDFSGERKERYFTDLNESSLEDIIKNIPELVLQEKSISEDVRPDRDEKWLNAILTKEK